MTKSSFAAVDLGATSGRVALGTFGPDGFTLDEVHRFANTPIVIDGVLCWDVEYLFEETLTGLAHACTRVAQCGSTLAGIAVDSWGVDYGIVDASNSLVAPVRHYRAAEDSVVELANEMVSSSEAYARTGITELPINTCFQFIRDARLGLLQPGVTALLTPDLWTLWLSGVRGAERTIASTTGLLDWTNHEWAGDLMERWGIPGTVVANIVETGSLAGPTLATVTERIGARNPIPVYRAPAHDTASAFAAVTSVGSDAAVVSCGTWALVGRMNETAVLTKEAEQAGFTNEVAADGSSLLIRNLSGTWLLEECLRIWVVADAGANGGSKVDTSTDTSSLRTHLLVAAESESARVEGIIDCGAPELIGTRDMPTEIVDLYRRNHENIELTRAQVVRLILESLAESFARTIARAKEITGTPFREIIMIGGGSRIEQLVALTEQATDLRVRVGHPEATSIGNICVQAVSAGVFDTMDQARAVTHAQQKEN